MSLLLASGVCLLPFLLAYPQLFQAEWLAAALGVAAALAVLARRSAQVVPVPGPARWLAGFALFLAAQALVGKPVYLQLPLLSALYVLYAALMIWLGTQLAASAGVERVAGIFAACLLAGALANAAAGVIQFYGIPTPLQDIVAELKRDPKHIGAYGNIAQPNLYANYLALGGTALLFLWLRGSLRTAFAVAAAVLLAGACALSGSRTTLVYALWFALLGVLAGRTPVITEGRQLKFAAFGLAGVMLAAQLALPWLNQAYNLGPPSQGAFERLAEISSNHTEVRWQLWLLALGLFADAPILGNGIGEFAGAAFSAGLSPGLAQVNNVVWTSPHNLPLQLLAETGALGTFLALAALATWWWRAGRRYIAGPHAAIWWGIAAVGIETIHSMFEFPLWNAHFLGVTALLMGLATKPAAGSGAASRYTRLALAATCVALALAMAMLFRDYVRLNATRAVGTPLTLAGAADTERDLAVMRELTHGPLAPAAEYWLTLGAPLDRTDVPARLEMSERAARYFPSHAILVRRTVFLAFNGQATEARNLLERVMQGFPQRCAAAMTILRQALAADHAAIEPLLTLAGRTKGCS